MLTPSSVDGSAERRRQTPPSTTVALQFVTQLRQRREELLPTRPTAQRRAHHIGWPVLALFADHLEAHRHIVFVFVTAQHNRVAQPGHFLPEAVAVDWRDCRQKAIGKLCPFGFISTVAQAVADDLVIAVNDRLAERRERAPEL